jgi:hypothetical protein
MEMTRPITGPKRSLPFAMLSLVVFIGLALVSCSREEQGFPGQGGISPPAAYQRAASATANTTVMIKTAQKSNAAEGNTTSSGTAQLVSAWINPGDAKAIPAEAKPPVSQAENDRDPNAARNGCNNATSGEDPICRATAERGQAREPAGAQQPAMREATSEQIAQALIKAYPDHLVGFDGTNLVWKDGKKMPLSEGAGNKATDELVNHPDIKDMFTWRYDFGGTGLPARRGADAGRVRNEEFFTKMYGPCNKKPGEACGNVVCKSKGAVVTVPWVPGMGGGTMLATTINGVDKKLRAVSEELDRLGPDYKKYLVPNGGSYVPRCIAGTSRLSVHSFGIAFDISPAYGQYWQYGLERGISEERFEKQNKPLVYKNKIPIRIVEIFEKHGFIWGGSWYHFDGMHFEYRPEFMALRDLMTRQASGPPSHG